MSSNRRVVITGVGAVTPFGVGAPALWQGVIGGQSAVAALAFDGVDLPCRAAAQVPDFQPAVLLGRVEARRQSRFVQFLLVAAQEAWSHARLSSSPVEPRRIATVVGNGSGGLPISDAMANWKESGWRRLDPLLMLKALPDMAAAKLSVVFGLRGPILTCAASCSSSTIALGQALTAIRNDSADVAVVGGTEAWVTPLGVASFCALQALSTRRCPPAEASCPFDRHRDGFVPGEGAGVLILEELQHAKRRGAPIVAEISGYGSTADARYMLAPAKDAESAAACIRLALEDGGVEPVQVGYVNAHGTSTILNDVVETRALKLVLGAHAYETPISSTKSMVGHTLGASGAIETIVTAIALREQILPPTINLNEPDPECDLDYVPHRARRISTDVGLKPSFAFGGQNACLVLRRCSDAVSHT